MKTISKLFAALVILTFASVNVNAQDDATETANAAATIITPIAISNSVGLNFGNIAAGSAAGTVELTTDGQRNEANVILPSIPGTVTAAVFTVTGLEDAAYTITLPENGDVVLDGPGDDMSVTDFNHDVVSNLLTDGSVTFNVGATLNVGASQLAGEYTGEFDVTVAYE